MQLSESEVQQIIEASWAELIKRDGIVYPTTLKLYAAHAIAERQAEGVIFECVGPATDHWIEADSYSIVTVKDEEHDGVQVIIECPEWDERKLVQDGVQGKRLHVYVVEDDREEGNGS